MPTKTLILTILKYAVILLLSYLITYAVVIYSPLNIPEYIPYTPIKIYGLFLTGFSLAILIIALKGFLKKKPCLSLLKLMLIGTAIGFLNELAFQFFLSFTDANDKLYYYVKGVVNMSLIYTFLSFFIAFQLKTKRTDRLIFIIFALGILVQALNWLFPELGILK